MTEYTAYELLQELKPYAPKWYKYLSKEDTDLNINIYDGKFISKVDNIDIDMTVPAECVLGEMYKFTNIYMFKPIICETCVEIDNILYTAISEWENFTMKQFLVLLVDHLKSKTCSGIVC